MSDALPGGAAAGWLPPDWRQPFKFPSVSTPCKFDFMALMRRSANGFGGNQRSGLAQSRSF
jgi:hypothetical protein